MKWKVKKEIEDKFFNFQLNENSFSKINNHFEKDDIISSNIKNHKNEFIWEIGLKLYYMSIQDEITNLLENDYYKFSNYLINSLEICYRSPTISLKDGLFLSILIQIPYYYENNVISSIEIDRIVLYYNALPFNLNWSSFQF